MEGADHFFQRLEKRHPEGPGDPVGAYLSTHPLTHERVAALRTRASRAGFAERGPLRPFPGDAGS